MKTLTREDSPLHYHNLYEEPDGTVTGIVYRHSKIQQRYAISILNKGKIRFLGEFRYFEEGINKGIEQLCDWYETTKT